MASQHDVPVLRGPPERPERLLQAQGLLPGQARQRLLVPVQVLEQRGGQEQQLLVQVVAQEQQRVLRQPELPGAS